jgi:hypothetical protein
MTIVNYMRKFDRELGEVNKHILESGWSLSDDRLEWFVNFLDPDTVTQELLQEVLNLREELKKLHENFR